MYVDWPACFGSLVSHASPDAEERAQASAAALAKCESVADAAERLEREAGVSELGGVDLVHLATEARRYSDQWPALNECLRRRQIFSCYEGGADITGIQLSLSQLEKATR